jgi:hypothetical protein
MNVINFSQEEKKFKTREVQVPTGIKMIKACLFFLNLCEIQNFETLGRALILIL